MLAAASMSDVLPEVAAVYQASTGRQVRFSFGPSDGLAAQVKRGAPADAVIFAGQGPVEDLAASGLIVPASRRVFASNALVVIAQAGPGSPGPGPRAASLSEIATRYTGRIAVADPQLAPAGRYAEAALRSAGVWEAVAPRLLPGLDVRNAAAAVAAGNAEFGIVYRTDAAAIEGVEVVFAVPPDMHPAIVYEAAVVAASPNREAAANFTGSLMSAETAAILARHGFGPAPSDPVTLALSREGRGDQLMKPAAPAPSDLSIVLLSLRVALAAMLIVVPLGLAVAWLLVRKQVPGKFWIETLVSLPLALTPVVIGFALLSALGRSSPAGGFIHRVFGADIAFTWVAAAIASAAVAFPLSVRAFMVAFSGVDRRLELVARSLGAGPWRTLFTVTLPLACPGIAAGLLLGFVRALSEFGATIVVAGNIPGETQTLPLAIFTRITAGDDGAATRLIAVSVVLAAASIAVHNYLVARGARPAAGGPDNALRQAQDNGRSRP